MATFFCSLIFSFAILHTRSVLAIPTQSIGKTTPDLQAEAIDDLDDRNVTSNILIDYVFTDYGVLKIHHSQLSWNDARNICLDEKAQLTIIDSASKESILLKYMKANDINAAWIGVHDLFGKRQWTTIKGDRLYTLAYVHWRNGEPNGAGAGEHCVELHHAGMNDMPCETDRSFICERNGIDVRSM